MPTTPRPLENDRAALRRELKQRRAALSASERISAATALIEQLEKIPEFLTDERVAGYWAVAGELPLAAILGGLRARGQVYHLPVIEERVLRFAPWWPGMAIAMNRYDIPEPATEPDRRVGAEDVDVVLVPLLGFDRAGQRLGFGGGFYDRTFAFLADRPRPSRPLLVGIGYARQEIERIEPAPWDVPLDYVATERELIDLTPAET